MGSGLHRSKITMIMTPEISNMTTEEMDAKCDVRGGGKLYYQDISVDEWRKRFLSWYPDTEIEELVKMHLYQIAMTLMMTKEEEAAAANEENSDWEEVPDAEVNVLIEAGEAAIARYMKWKQENKKKKSSSAIAKEKKKKMEPEKKKKEKVDLIARFKNTNRTYLPAKAFQKWLEEEENEDKPTLVHFFNPVKKTFAFKRLTMGDKNPKWVVENWDENDLEEGEDYI